MPGKNWAPRQRCSTRIAKEIEGRCLRETIKERGAADLGPSIPTTRTILTRYDSAILRFLFLGQGGIPAPGPLEDEPPLCGLDPTLETPEELTCDAYEPAIACL